MADRGVFFCLVLRVRLLFRLVAFLSVSVQLFAEIMASRHAKKIDARVRRFLRAYDLSLFTKNVKKLFLETEKPICNINDSNTFILIFVVSSTGNYNFGISIPDL